MFSRLIKVFFIFFLMVSFLNLVSAGPFSGGEVAREATGTGMTSEGLDIPPKGTIYFFEQSGPDASGWKFEGTEDDLIDFYEKVKTENIQGVFIVEGEGDVFYEPEELDSFVSVEQGYAINPSDNRYQDLWESVPAPSQSLARVTSDLNDLQERLNDPSLDQDAKSDLQKQFDQKNSFLRTQIDAHPQTFTQTLAGMDEAQRTQLIEGMQCQSDGVFSSIGCFFSKSVDERTLANKEVKNLAHAIENRCRGGCSVEQYNNELNGQVNDRINSLVEIHHGSRCEGGDCLDQIQCDGNAVCESDLKAAKALDLQRYKLEKLDYGIAYDIADMVLRPDSAALGAAQLFGFEANFSSLPAFLRDDFASQVCYAKIEGYLDKEVANGGGITKYTITNTSKEISVRADIRAQRTPVTPDGKVAISYSYFLRANGEPVEYIIAISYIADGQSKKISLFEEPRQLAAGGVGDGYENVNVPLNTTNVNEGSFKIGLISKTTSGEPYIILTYPIVFISSGDSYYEAGAGGNDVGHEQAVTQKENQEEADETAGFLGLMS